MTLKDVFKPIDNITNPLNGESGWFQHGQIVATALSSTITKVGVFISNKPQRSPTEPIEFAYIGQVVTFSMSGPSKSNREFEEWK